MAFKIKPRELTTAAPFKDLFELDAELVKTLADSMRARGYDTERPIIAWRPAGKTGPLVVVEGHMRLAAAIKARIPEVPVVARAFADETAAFMYALAEQRDRRNLTKGEIANAIARAEIARQGPIPDAGIGSRGGKPADPATPAVVEQAAELGIGKSTARRELADVRAEQAEAAGEPAKPAKTPRKRAPVKTKTKPAPTLDGLNDQVTKLQELASEAARLVAAAVESSTEDDVRAAMRAVAPIVAGYDHVLDKLVDYTEHHHPAPTTREAT